MTGRSANGESSICKGRDGRWHGYVSIGVKEKGQRDRRHVSGARRSDVVAKVRALEARRNAGVVQTSGRAPTVADWLEHWLTTIAVRRIRPKTYDGYESHVRLHLIPHLGHHRLDRLQPEHLERCYLALEAEGLSTATVSINHRILSRSLKVAVQRARIGRNVATLVDPPSVKRVPIQPLLKDEVRRVLRAAEGRRNAPRWSVALALALRQGEALGAPGGGQTSTSTQAPGR